jgi:ABC-type transport system involved in cytochrome c biogenesis permease subunit
MRVIPLVLYLVAAVLYSLHFARRSRPLGRAATVALSAGALVHTFAIGMQTMDLGQLPIAGTTGAISAFVWLLALAYLYVELTTEERAIGVFIVPLLAILQVMPTADVTPPEPSVVLRGPWFALHVSSLLFAYASFALACVIGVTYMLLFNEIKAKQLGFFYARLPSLQTLDRMNVRAVTVGWIFLTIGVVAGAIWTPQAQVQAPADPRLQAMSLLDPKVFIALVCWGVYAFELYAHRVIGWRGRRAAWLSTIGFAIVLLNFLPVSYFLTRSHNFQ